MSGPTTSRRENRLLAERGELDQYRDGVERFTAQLLGGYVRGLQFRGRPGQKELNDAVWKTIVLFPLEVLILDSPILQRLRWIRQLGVADYVFDAASHTRLQHSIGTLHAADRLVESINASSGRAAIDSRFHRLIRLTALCHDIGHGAMSHVSDNGMRLVERSEDVRLQFQERLELDRTPSLSEVAAYYMLGSAAFGGLLSQAQATSSEHVLPDDPHLLMQQAVVGIPILDQFPQLHELISGPFDADKLDYMTRDAQMAGVPEVTDVPRLVRKVRARDFARNDMPSEISKEVAGDLVSYTMLGIAHSGARTLDELMLGRILLFDKIYRHHKIRAVEAMVASILLRLARLTDGHPAMVPLLFSDEQLLDITMETVARIAGHELTAAEAADAEIAVRFARMVKQRDVLVRCFAFAVRMPLDPYVSDSEQRAGIYSLLRASENTTERGTLARRVADEVAVMLRLAQPDLLEQFPADQIVDWIWFDPPESSTEANLVSRAYLITDDGRIIRYRDDYSESKAWTDAYLQAREVGYIFGPRALSSFVYLAAEKVVREEYGVRIPSMMVDYAKRERVDLERRRRDLELAGYYATSPRDIRPVPHRLTRGDIERRLYLIAERLGGYMGPGDDKAPDGLVKPGRIRDFIRQFETDELIDAALLASEQLRLIGRQEVVASVRSFIEGNADFAGANVCALGSPKDSAFFNAYFALDAAREFGLKPATLGEALVDDQAILFVDDFIGSGSQAIDVVESWLDAPRTTDLHEFREILPSELRPRLQHRPTAFVYAAGERENGGARLAARIRELGLDARVSIHIDSSTLPNAFETVHYDNDTQRTAFFESCADTGRRLLETWTDRDTAWIDERILGYGNKAYLITFPYNTPTQALTCFWAGGPVSGTAWMPLMPRRKKT